MQVITNNHQCLLNSSITKTPPSTGLDLSATTSTRVKTLQSSIKLNRFGRPFYSRPNRKRCLSLEYRINSCGINCGIFIGNYPKKDPKKQDKILWQVIAREPDRLLLLSRYGIDCRKFHYCDRFTNWANSDLRRWLNETLYSQVFTEEEKSFILNANTIDSNSPEACEDYQSLVYAEVPGYYEAIERPVVPEYPKPPAYCTRDKVFLLSCQEVEKYLERQKDRILIATQYAWRHGSKIYDDDYHCWWWLRCQGVFRYYAIVVYHDGFIIKHGTPVSCLGGSVRPAIWVKYE